MIQAIPANDENMMVVLDVNNRKYIHKGINASMFWAVFTEINWQSSLQIKREIYEVENLKIIFIAVQGEN
jgi:hypothetical protein